MCIRDRLSSNTLIDGALVLLPKPDKFGSVIKQYKTHAITIRNNNENKTFIVFIKKLCIYIIC